MLYLKARRLLRGSSLRDVQRGTGISISILSQIETNRVNPRPDELAKLAKYFHVDAAVLLTHIDERTIGVGATDDVRDARREALDDAEERESRR